MSIYQKYEEQTFKLVEDVMITSVMNIKQDIRDKFMFENTDFIVTRPQGRARSLVIEQEVAEFLEAFRKPITLRQAAQNFVFKKNKNMSEFMLNIDETVKRMQMAGFLVEPGAMSINRYFLNVGELVDDAKILVGVNVQDDTEIYCCKNSLGKLLALKIGKHPGSEQTNTLIETEYSILSVAPHPITPVPYKKGNYHGKAYVLMDWCDGQDVLLAANQIRNSTRDHYPFDKLRKLVVDLLRSYEMLHACKIVHGDVHPKNCLLSPSGTIHIIDFGLSLHLSSFSKYQTADRRGVPYFYDPDFASAFLDNKTPVSANLTSDLYALAALSYLLLTGYHYLPFRYDRRQFFQQIKLEPMRSFVSLGIPSWPAVEAVLAQALSKNENERFLSAGAFADALCEPKALARTTDSLEKKADPLKSRAAIAYYERKGLVFDWPLMPPTASVHFGSAGIAYALLKCAERNSDAEAFSDADIWITRAKKSSGHYAYVNEAIGISEKVASPHSLHYGQLGVSVCEAMIACARWDYSVVNASILEVCSLALNAPEDFDLMSGKVGCLLGCALLLESIPDDVFILSRKTLIETGQAINAIFVEKLQATGSIASSKIIIDYGMAHGWAGVLYSLMRWAEIAQIMPDKIVKQFLQELALLSIPAEVGRRWPIGPNSARDTFDKFSASWCKGSSGFVHLFSLAYETYGDLNFLETAIAAADYAFSAPPNGANLCCGDAGLAYAQLAAFRLTNDKKFVDRAMGLSDRGINRTFQLESSLYKGSLGLHFLTHELTTPNEARMPFFERLGWPVMHRKNPLEI